MLRWSAQETGRSVDLAAIVDSSADLGLDGGEALVAVGDAAAGADVDSGPVERLAEIIGIPAAVRAAAVAGAFELYNRVVDAAGLPVGRVARRRGADVIETLGLEAMPHAGHGD
jgi:hypothetical protein